MIAVATIRLLVAVALGAAVLARGTGPGGDVARWLRWAALAVALAVSVALTPAVTRDAGGFAIIALGLPVLLAAAPLVAQRSPRGAAAVTWACGLLLLAWALLLGLGIGLYLLPAAVLLLLAAASSPRTTRSARA